MDQLLMQKYPQLAGDPLAMAMFCCALVEHQKFDEAYEMGLAACEGAPDDMEVRDLVQSALGSKLPQWHIPMLHDGPRNRAYALAIRRAVKPGMTVLEIGTGAGFLAMVAAKAGARVYTCEADPLVAAAAAKIVRRNNLHDQITVIPKRSDQIELGKDLPQPADLLMSELFDDTLYGDNIVSIIADAKNRLLKLGASVLPPRAQLRCALITHKLSPKRRPLLEIEGFDFTAFNVLAPRYSSILRCSSKHSQRLSEPASALVADFQVEAPFGERETGLKLISSGGRVSAVAQWLRVDFGDGLVFENDPFHGPLSHWGSPVYPLARPLETAPGEVVEVTVRRALESLIIINARRG
ncbi:MAG: 50S ribosomal protein L11 methyltransferase [Sphingomonas sp.]|nr:50S ribosomal protein L11 methyltransferase [Sphingomonas sp.]